MNSYEEFAYIYDTLMDDFDYPSWAKYIKEIINRENNTGNTILEMACGTGSLTGELLKLGYKVDGFDLSSDMLTIARDKLKNHKDYRLFNLDMTDFSMDKNYNVIICACDSMNYIIKEEDLLNSFKCVYDHLEPEGLFIFDINSHYKLTQVLGDNIFIEDRDDIFYTWDNHLDKDEDIVDFFLTFFIKKGNLYKRFDEHHIQKAFKIENIKELLHTSGFRDIKVYEGFTFSVINDKTERINLVVKK